MNDITTLEKDQDKGPIWLKTVDSVVNILKKFYFLKE